MTVIYMLPKIAEMRRKIAEVRHSETTFMCAKPAVGASIETPMIMSCNKKRKQMNKLFRFVF